ncbi:MAG: 4-(cytidine 5'-diphospho)-2-C-methyl-D-erythritol kinase [Vicinamibacteria bacterium]|nr:4-(cytidine 5'-diphospho)-2-C-methyl-D-erythritol kinase [Vicinamibacteria bacterium]
MSRITRRPSFLTVPAFAKINLGIEVLGSRQDGYHELRTLFQTISLHDDIELRRRRAPGVVLRCEHPLIPRDETNLAVRAARDLMRHAGLPGGVEIRLTKRIPVAGGLGGGSSDAAAVLMALDRLFELDLGPARLHAFARRLGADVPFFLLGGTALGLGRGDEVYPLEKQLRAEVVVIDMGRPVSTAAVFRRLGAQLTLKENGYTIFRFVSSDWGDRASFRILTNELERSALEEAPDLADTVRRVRRILVGEGALFAGMSGSGSSCFGLFIERAAARRAVKATRAAGFAAHRGRTVTLGGFRRTWSLRFGR